MRWDLSAPTTHDCKLGSQAGVSLAWCLCLKHNIQACLVWSSEAPCGVSREKTVLPEGNSSHLL